MTARSLASLIASSIALGSCGSSSEPAGGADAGGPAKGGACAPIADSTPAVCSMAGAARNVIFTNNCTQPVDIWWVNATCGETFYRRLDPGASYTQPSFVTHPWRARTVVAGAPMGTAKGMLIKEFGPIPAGMTDLPFTLP